MNTAFLVTLLLFCVSFSFLDALDNGLGKAPPMGWNSWNNFRLNISESIIKSQADGIVSSGLASLGYVYLNIDDGWANVSRGDDGSIVPNRTLFPSGMKSLGDYIHGKGLKYGIYSDAGMLTCAGMQGSLTKESPDAQTFASWGVDYLKYDNCQEGIKDGPTANAQLRYSAMRDALNATGRPIFFAMCTQGYYNTWEWGSSYGNSYRLTFDIKPSWGRTMAVYDISITYANYSRPYAWGDADMLEVGIGFLDVTESRAHFSLWAAMKSPLLIAVDTKNISPPILNILSNSEIIAINQDPLGIPVTRIKFDNSSAPYDILMGPLSGDAHVVILFNRDGVAQNITWEMSLGPYPLTGEHQLRDLWSHSDLGGYSDRFTATVPPHDVIVLKVETKGNLTSFSPNNTNTNTTNNTEVSGAGDPYLSVPPRSLSFLVLLATSVALAVHLTF